VSVMIRTLTILLVAASSALAQATPLIDTTGATPIRFRTGRDINTWPVRVRPANDTVIRWMHGTARRLRDSELHEVRDSTGRALLGPPATRWRVEVQVNPEAVRRHHTNMGMATGAVLGGMGIVAGAMACRDASEGPPCSAMIIAAPAGALLGAIVGAMIGQALPAVSWQRVAP
jgi:hypothetical protein